MDSTWYEGFVLRKQKARRQNASQGPQRPDSGGSGRNAQMSRSVSETILLPRPVQALKPNLSSTALEFLDRQAKHRSFSLRQGLSKCQIEVRREMHSSDDVKFWGAKGVPGFLTYLNKKFGSIVMGWRALDEDNNGRLTFYEFCNACRRMGYHGNLKKLWHDLDQNLNGSVSLAELDPEAGRLLGEFKLALMNEYGDMVTAWTKGLDTNGSGRIDEPEVEAAVKKLGLKLDPKRLYTMLRSSPAKATKGVTLKELDEIAWQRWRTGDVKGLIAHQDKEFIEDMPGMGDEVPWPQDVQGHQRTGAAIAWRQELRNQDKAAGRKALDDIKKVGLHDVKDFRRALIGTCGSLRSAWQQVLDIDGNGRVPFAEFCQAFHRLGYHGPIRELFSQLDSSGKGYMLFGDLDRSCDKALSELREKLTQVHGNMLLAWLKELDARGTGFCSKTDFLRACRNVGFTGDAAKLFRKLQPETGRRLITLRDFDTKAYLALSRGDYRMLSESNKPAERSLLYMSFEERQSSGFFHQIRRAWDASDREEFAKACHAEEPDWVIDTVEEFELLCLRKYGSITQAWRQCLDWDHNGRLTFNELCAACRRLGYAGDLKALWAEFGGKEHGHLTLKELDPQADELIKSFLELLTLRYGHLDIAWKKGFGKDPHDTLDRGELEKALAVLGYPHSAKKLFKALIPDKGKVLLTIWDLDPSCSRERARGGGAAAGAVSEPKSPGHVGKRGHTLGAEDGTVGPPAGPSAGAVSWVKHLRNAMRNQFGSTTAAWRAALGLQSDAPFVQFGRILRECQFQGSVKELWREISSTADKAGTAADPASRGKDAEASPPGGENDLSMTSLAAIDPQVQAIVNSTRECLLARFGTLLKAWKQCMAVARQKKAESCNKDGLANVQNGAGVAKGQPRIDEANFDSFCQHFELDLKNPQRSFKLLLARPMQQRCLVMGDFEALLLGVPVADRPTVWGEADPIPPEVVSRQFFEQQQKDFSGKNKAVTSLDGFRAMLIKQFGSLWSAWRNFLDEDRNGVLTQQEFGKCCQQYGFRSVNAVWSLLDAAQTGQISLSNLDPAVTELFGELDRLLNERYGSVRKGWTKCFENPEPRSPQVDQKKFVRQCKVLGFSGNAAQLYKLVRPESGRKNQLFFEDLWRSLNKNATTAESGGSRQGTTTPAPRKEARKEQTQDGSTGQAQDFILVEDSCGPEPQNRVLLITAIEEEGSKDVPASEPEAGLQKEELEPKQESQAELDATPLSVPLSPGTTATTIPTTATTTTPAVPPSPREDELDAAAHQAMPVPPPAPEDAGGHQVEHFPADGEDNSAATAGGEDAGGNFPASGKDNTAATAGGEPEVELGGPAESQQAAGGPEPQQAAEPQQDADERSQTFEEPEEDNKSADYGDEWEDDKDASGTFDASNALSPRERSSTFEADESEAEAGDKTGLHDSKATFEDESDAEAGDESGRNDPEPRCASKASSGAASFEDESEADASDQPGHNASKASLGAASFEDESEADAGEQPGHNDSKASLGAASFEDESEADAGDQPGHNASKASLGAASFEDESEADAGDQPGHNDSSLGIFVGGQKTSLEFEPASPGSLAGGASELLNETQSEGDFEEEDAFEEDD